MTKYRIREEIINGVKKYYIERKGLIFWHDIKKYDSGWKKFMIASFDSLELAKEYLKRKREFEEELNNPPQVKVTYYKDV